MVGSQEGRMEHNGGNATLDRSHRSDVVGRAGYLGQRCSARAPQLSELIARIELSPFTFPHSPSRIFTGSKQSSLLTIDLRNGQQLNCFSSLAANRSGDDCVCENEQLLDDMDSRSRSNRDVLFIGRTDYRLTIHTPPGADVELGGLTIGERRKQGGVQEIVYSTYTPNSFDRPLAELWSKMGQTDLVEEDGSLVKRMRVELGHDNIAIGVEQGSGYRWSAPLGAAG